VRTSLRFHILGLISAATIASTTGCNLLLGVEDLTQSDPDAAVDIDAPPGTVTIRFVNVVRDFPGSGTIDVYIGDEPTARVTALRQVSSYVVVDPSVTRISLRQQGQSGGAPLHEFTGLTLAGDTKVTAVIAGVNASQSADDRVRLLPFVEEFAQAGTGQAQVRFVHAITDVTDVAIDVGLNNAAAPEVVGLPRFGASAAAGMQAEAGRTLRLGLVEGGTTFTAFAANGLELGKGCFVIFSGQRSAAFNSLGVMTSTTVCTSQTPVIGSMGARVAVGHVISDATACDLRTIDGNPLIESLEARELGTLWLLAEDENFVGVTLICAMQSVSVDLNSDFALESPRHMILAGGSLSPDFTNQARLMDVSIPSTGLRHAYFVNLSAGVGDGILRIDGSDVVGNQVFGASIIGPAFGHAASVLSSGGHTLSYEDVGQSVTMSFTVTGGTGGATLFVLEGARVPQGAQRPLRLTPFDLGAFPPAVGTPTAPN